MTIPDAPWIREAERTGHYRYGFWNTPPEDYDDEFYDVIDYDDDDEDERRFDDEED